MRHWAGTCVILGHHYQRDEVIRFADFRGDSYKLSQQAAAAAGKYIVFCGVHFMAESADMLSHPGQVTILPDLNAGCSMADMAEITQVEDCWEQLVSAGLTDDAGQRDHAHHLHELHCRDQGLLRRAWRSGLHLFECGGRVQVGVSRRIPRFFFLPDQHLGRNTGYSHGHSAERNGGVGSVPDQWRPHAGASDERPKSFCGRDTARFISGFCRSMWTMCAPSILAFA